MHVSLRTDLSSRRPRKITGTISGFSRPLFRKQQKASSTSTSTSTFIFAMTESSYINTPSSELDESKQADTPSRKAIRKTAKVLRGTLPRREIFAKYEVAKTTDYRIIKAESSHRRRMNSERKSKLSTNQVSEIIE